MPLLAANGLLITIAVIVFIFACLFFIFGRR